MHWQVFTRWNSSVCRLSLYTYVYMYLCVCVCVCVCLCRRWNSSMPSANINGRPKWGTGMPKNIWMVKWKGKLQAKTFLDSPNNFWWHSTFFLFHALLLYCLVTVIIINMCLSTVYGYALATSIHFWLFILPDVLHAIILINTMTWINISVFYPSFAEYRLYCLTEWYNFLQLV